MDIIKLDKRVAQEVFEDLKYRLESMGYLPDEYFLMDSHWENGRTIPKGANIFCTTDYGASEGVYLDVYLKEEDFMRKVTISIQVDVEKLRAIQFYVGKKDSTLESELEDCITKIYEKFVPAQTREYIECMSAPERPSRPSRSALRTEEAGGER